MHRLSITKQERDDRQNVIYYQEDGAAGQEAHVFPDDTLDWRCAEYDYDPDDVETLVETILAERWEEPSDPSEIVTLAKAQRGQNKRTRIQQVGLVIANKGPTWQAALAQCRKPTIERVSAFRWIIENPYSDEARTMMELHRSDRLDQELGRGLFQPQITMMRERLSL